MVVISAAILSKTGPLVARQFVEITKIRIEGLLSAFLKLVDGGGGTKDHTYIETKSVRYVYQPMENLYLLLVTNKGSNILEDMDTLKLMQQCVQSSCLHTPVQKEHILAQAFDIIFAFDEVISFGYREAVTFPQIRTFTEMESHEEKLQNMIRKSKEAGEAGRRKEIAKKLNKEHAAKKREERERQRTQVEAAFDAMTLSGGHSRPTSPDVGGSPRLGAAAQAAPDPHPTAAAGGGAAPRIGMSLGRKPLGGGFAMARDGSERM